MSKWADENIPQYVRASIKQMANDLQMPEETAAGFTEHGEQMYGLFASYGMTTTCNPTFGMDDADRLTFIRELGGEDDETDEELELLKREFLGNEEEG